MRTEPLANILTENRSGFWGSEAGAGEVDVRVVRNGDIQDYGVRWGKLPLRGVSVAEAERAAIREGDILITTSGNCGYVAHVKEPPPEPTIASNFVRILRFNPDSVVPRYMFHFFHSDQFRLRLSPYIRGTTLKNLSLSTAAERINAPLPSLAAQRRVAEILDTAEVLRTKRSAALAELDTLTQSIFLAMFGDPATNSNGWAKAALRDLGRVSTGGTPPTAIEGMFGGPIPFITPGDLESEGPIKRSVTEAGAEEVGTVHAGATLVCCIGATIGKIGKATTRSAFNQQINAVEWGSTVDPEYGFAVLRFFKPTIIAWGSSTTLPILKKSAFERIEIPVPPVEEQREFKKRVAHLDDLRAADRVALARHDELFVALQARAFRGDL